MLNCQTWRTYPQSLWIRLESKGMSDWTAKYGRKCFTNNDREKKKNRVICLFWNFRIEGEESCWFSLQQKEASKLTGSDVQNLYTTVKQKRNKEDQEVEQMLKKHQLVVN